MMKLREYCLSLLICKVACSFMFFKHGVEIATYFKGIRFLTRF